MHAHILGICGTFMGGVARLAREAGMEVSGSDQYVYPPMSTQLREAGIEVTEGYDPAQLQPSPDLVVIGNALSRGNPTVEYVLDHRLPYTSGPQWLAREVLAGRDVVAVAGTHGKTSVASMLAWILEREGKEPGFLIGGVPQNFGISARLGSGHLFVVEADEYDTAFFDKRSKFVHYLPRVLILNNLEYDHADIFADLPAIKTQFHHLIRTIPGNGMIIQNAADAHLADVIAMGCWTPRECFGLDGDSGDPPWQARNMAPDGREFEVFHNGRRIGCVEWGQSGRHNVLNGLAAIAAASHAGVRDDRAVTALGEFQGVKRRLELRATVGGVQVYDDFAHHPTAIETTLAGLRNGPEDGRLLVILEPRSNTMRRGVHRESLAPSLAGADRVWLYRPADLGWDIEAVAAALGPRATSSASIDEIIEEVAGETRKGDRVVIMSNGDFGGLHDRLIARLKMQH